MKMKTFVFYILVVLSANLGAQIPGEKVSAIFVDEFGRQWLGTDNGLVVKTGDSYTAYYTNPDVPGTVTGIELQHATEGKVVWVSTTKGLCRFGYSKKAISAATFFGKDKTGFDSEVINGLTFDKNNSGIFATPTAVGIVIKEKWKSYAELPDVYDNHFTSANVKGDTIYVGTKGEGVGRLVHSVDGYTGASSLVRPWSSLVSDNITCIFIDSKGNRWYGTDKGLSRHSKSDAKQGWDFSLTDKLPDSYITCITEDKSGNLWIGTKGGMVVLNPSLEIKTIYTISDGLLSNVINAVAADKEGTIWAGTDSGVTQFRDGVVSNIKTSDYTRNFINLLNSEQ